MTVQAILGLSRGGRSRVLFVVGEDEDAALVDRLRSGDLTAFEAVYERWHRRIYAFLYRLLLRRDLAEDLSQEVWVRFATAAYGLRRGDRLGPWLFRVARNLVHSRGRRAGVAASATPLITELYEQRAPATPLDRVVSNHLREALERALAALPLADRELIVLVGVEGLAPQEAAEVLSIRPEALRKRLERARAKMREHLPEWSDDEAHR